MNRTALIICFLLATCICPLFAFQDQVVVISPPTPKVGDEVTMTYNAKAKSATLREAKEITAEVFVIGEGMPVLKEIPLSTSAQGWKGSFKLTDEKSKLFLVRFMSGDLVDDNGENVWSSLVYGSDGKPVKGAHLQHAYIFQSGSFFNFKHEKDMTKAKAELAKEKELYPDNWAATAGLWGFWMRESPTDETKAKIKEELAPFYERYKDNEDVVAGVLRWFEQTGQKEKAEEIRKTALASNPKGKVAQSMRLSEVYAEQDLPKRAVLLEKFLDDFPQQGQNLDNYRNQLISTYIQAKQNDKALSVLNASPKPDGMMLNSIAWGMIERGEELEKAVEWAKKAVDIYRNSDASSKPSYVTAKGWKKNQESGLGMILDTYAFGLQKLGRLQEALTSYEEAYNLTNGTHPDINARLVESYVANGKNEKAMQVANECVRKGNSTDKLLEQYKMAYVKAKGSDKGFDDEVKKVRNVAKNDIRQKLMKERVNKPAIDFSLVSLEGKSVKLSELKGKIVVLDFWATWCGPCKASFPYLQKVYDKYKNNDKIVILAVNTWENKTGKEREQLVKDFMKDNKYTFPVIYDVNFVEKYNVEGIPTKFIIDKNGKIQFKDIGFGNGQEMIDKLDLQFEMLLSDEFYSSVN